MLAGSLLKEAEELLRMGLKPGKPLRSWSGQGFYWHFFKCHPGEVADGYELALDKALQVLETLSCHEVKNINDKAEVKKVIRTSVMSKQYGNEDFLAELVN